MNFAQVFKTALHSFSSHKTRSLLTTLGIIIGVAALIAVKSIGDGAKDRVRQQIESTGTNFVLVLSTDPKALQPRNKNSLTLPNLSLKLNEYETILNETPGIALGSPGIFTRVQLVYESHNRIVSCVGASEHMLEIRNWPIQEGISITRHDIVGAKKVALIGQTIAKDLFPGDTPIGKTVRINKVPYEIIGLLAEKGRRADGFDEDDVIMCPYTTIQKRMLSVNDGLTSMLFSLKDRSTMSQTTETIRSILRHKKKLAADADDTFTIFNQDEIAKTSEAATLALNILLIIIASISLIVGGIGIMNIMLVTVTERTREIGLRMALGARKNTILLQFIIESIIVCMLGGIVGMLLGVGIAFSVGHFLGWNIAINQSAVAIAFLSSTLIGLFFGFYPAKKASNLKPVEALLER